jgi:hypothetical protein
MSKAFPALWSAAFIVLLGFGLHSAGVHSEPKHAQYIDLTAHFSRFVDETAGMEKAARVALFRKQMDPLLPGFYAPRFGMTPANYDEHIARAIEDFPKLRHRYEQMQQGFPAAFDSGIQHFRKEFPDFIPNVPVYLLHSVGEMDGGTRDLGGKVYLIFGADVIAQIHDAHDLTPFLDHELFHVENRKYFADCDQVWCPLWAEGLATYAAKVMNPGADDRQLALLPQTDPRHRGRRLSRSAVLTPSGCFSVRSRAWTPCCGRRGREAVSRSIRYYIGRVFEELGAEHKLPELAHMPPERAGGVVGSVDRLIQKAGGCK